MAHRSTASGRLAGRFEAPQKRPLSGLTFGDLRFVLHLSFFAADPKTHKVTTNGPLTSPGLMCCATCAIFHTFRTGLAPGAPGARRGPRRSESRLTNPDPDSSFYLPKVSPIKKTYRCRATLGNWDPDLAAHLDHLGHLALGRDVHYFGQLAHLAGHLPTV